MWSDMFLSGNRFERAVLCQFTWIKFAFQICSGERLLVSVMLILCPDGVMM